MKTPDEYCIQEIKEVWVVYTNTDLTEGRGYDYPLVVCEMPITAMRLARKEYVMGSDAPVRRDFAFKINGHWYSPAHIQPATSADKEQQKKIDAREAVIKKAKDAGLTDEEISLI